MSGLPLLPPTPPRTENTPAQPSRCDGSASRATLSAPVPATGGAGHLPEGKTAFGFLVHEGEHLPVVRNIAEFHVQEIRPPNYYGNVTRYSYTVWQSGVAWTENYSQRDWGRLVERGEAYEVDDES